MIPSKNWFPQGLEERAAWFSNFATQFQDIAVSLGFVAADSTAVMNDNLLVQNLLEVQMLLDAYKDAVRQYRIVITEGSIGEPTPAFPPPLSYGIPNPAITTGIFERLDNIVKRIRVAPAYTPEVGALLGIIPSSPTPPAELKPVIKASDSLGDYQYEVNVTRLGMPAFKVQIQRGGSMTWEDAGFATNNPATLSITPTTPDQPERIMVRAILLKNNEPVGQPSDPTYVTVNP